MGLAAQAAAGDPPLLPIEALERFLSQLVRPARILVAVSGGSDSLGLLTLLWSLSKTCPDAGCEVIAATIDHAMRPQAADEARSVARFCQERGITHVTRRWEGVKPQSGLMAAARQARYDLLLEIAAAQGASLIVTGHTLDDQIETVDMRAARPGGAAGIGTAGMAPAVLLDTRIWLARPLLASRRQALREWLCDQGIGFIDDPSNVDLRFERAALRASRQLDLAEASHRLRQIRAAGAARIGLNQAAAGLLDRHLRLHHAFLHPSMMERRAAPVARFSAAALDEPLDVLTHALGMTAAVLGGKPHVPSRNSMARVMASLRGQPACRVTAGGVVFERRREALFLLREERGLPVLFVEAGESAIWDGRFRIRNGSAARLRVAPPPPDLLPQRLPGLPPADEDLPRRIAQLSTRSFPLCVPAEAADAAEPAVAMTGDGIAKGRGQSVTMPAGVEIEPVLLPFERFLPSFDLALAQRLRCQFGLQEDLPPLPFRVTGCK
ncbi:tRNA lysidine(34) synthetase TilS [Rhizobium sp. SSA_523]|uniref:tRNA lysidine(34) synthetase TilS n=1 Tax=Rhizobium sp. SSA_523 TaxID=2952477 RepID=UPI002090A3EA|nr:tRNA lysidine(34) synthetase TilS [Rhizobium sp. SSA_523]MCO5732007.1 tRNA lysidine(34) synthetase TilS [Rhizobium sp. SSA_523]WKC22653.1 tRNA lysidine(34) synthetase TilS [Rhizobium sp. SSA_523]